MTARNNLSSAFAARVKAGCSKFAAGKFGPRKFWGGQALVLSLAVAGILTAQPAQAHLQCVPYARDASGIDIHGDARTWWHQANGSYARGSAPKVGAVMAMAASSAMPLGHVAVVSKIVDARHILIDQANWAGPGVIEHDVLVEDASTDGDWSEVRVWYAPANAMGTRLNPVSGFIYAPADGSAPDAAPSSTLTTSTTQIAAATPGTDALHAFMQATDRNL
ncbi:CHAP domain-containing protein [Novosphingobium sp. 9]|uniref:CHAP domain-containing protein n=1 Tax=Novosphingobium sp. 9 TaxID=2025349 RepID=UPI0021B55A1B|nr:CHAP domain-containing protein [Novosphingobium sp. 9]